MKPAPFEYHRAASVVEATGLLNELADDAKLLAGGQSLVPMLSLRLTSFGHLVDISRLSELRGIERRDSELWVGAGTSEAAVESDEQVRAAVPLLARVTPLIGHFQIRNRGTVGGSLAHADPAAEYPAVALALDARLHAVSVRGRRTVPAAEFFTGLWSTVLEPDEMLVGASFPVWSGRCGFGVEEFARRHGDFAIAGAVVGIELGAGDIVQRSAIGLLGLGSVPRRAPVAESFVAGCPLGGLVAEKVGELALAGLDDVPSDLHGSAAYRRRVGAVMVARAWAKAAAEANATAGEIDG